MRNKAPEQQTLIGESPSFLEIIDQCSRAARHDRPVLVIGERGTGKELIAARLHFLSPRWEQSFVQVNCAALPDSLLESELFGHEAGAFTGASVRRIGRFEEADNGTLFLDEIAITSQSAQEKILRVTEYGAYQRIGSNKTLITDVRLIGATNVDLPSAADRNEFRHDLLDRLAMDVITLPPLRHRQDDIIILAHHFGQRVARDRGWESFPGFSETLVEALMDYRWPGNIRELKNTIERAVYHAEDEADPIHHMTLDPFDSPYRPQVEKVEKAEDIKPEERPTLPSADPLDYGAVVAAYEKGLLQSALKASKYNQRHAAKHLDLTYHQLRHQLKKHGLL